MFTNKRINVTLDNATLNMNHPVKPAIAGLNDDLPATCPESKELRIGVIGAGSFAGFALRSFAQIRGVKIVAITDIDRSVADALAGEFQAMVYPDIHSLLENGLAELIYIATPPFLHYHQSKLALLAGKHVICEKPAALKVQEAEELLSLASSNRLLYVVNLMQRYNPLYGTVDRIVKEKVFGSFLHGYFENYASDENLDPSHWFWQETKSGGIFTEHGVHFFDLFAGWLGKGEVINAWQIRRPGIEQKIVDRVQASVLYQDGVVNFYHGFDQPKVLDRQEMRLVFERGDLTLYGWIPVSMKLHGLIKEDQRALLTELTGQSVMIPGDEVEADQRAKGRGKHFAFDVEIAVTSGDISEKQHRYRQLLIKMLTDQWEWIRDRSHQTVIDGNNAVESLRMAEQASEMAQLF